MMTRCSTWCVAFPRDLCRGSCCPASSRCISIYWQSGKGDTKLEVINSCNIHYTGSSVLTDRSWCYMIVDSLIWLESSGRRCDVDYTSPLADRYVDIPILYGVSPFMWYYYPASLQTILSDVFLSVRDPDIRCCHDDHTMLQITLDHLAIRRVFSLDVHE